MQNLRRKLLSREVYHTDHCIATIGKQWNEIQCEGLDVKTHKLKMNLNFLWGVVTALRKSAYLNIPATPAHAVCISSFGNAI